MKKILASLAIVGLLCSSSYAGGKIVKPKGSTYGEDARFISPPVMNGSYSEVVNVDREFKVQFDDGCIRWLYITTKYTRTRSYVWGSLTSDETVAGDPVEQLLGEFCP